jgi:hypothetical protein
LQAAFLPPTVFHRSAAAGDLAARLLVAPTASASGSGRFLAAPRRTGKSTFLREGVLLRLARSSSLDKVAVGGLAFALDRVGLARGVTLSPALAALSDETRAMTDLIVDEAQHAITSEIGANALFALKAARDELNSSAHHGLRIVATGSHRDKLAMLRSSKGQAFFGAPLVNFSPLGKDYIEWFVTHLPFRQEALVWKAARAVYALEDRFLAELIRNAGMLGRSPRSSKRPR